MQLRIGNWRIKIWDHGYIPQRFRKSKSWERPQSQVYNPFFWFYIVCRIKSGKGLPFIGTKDEFDLRTGHIVRHRVFRCPTSIQGNIGRYMFHFFYDKQTVCETEPLVLSTNKRPYG